MFFNKRKKSPSSQYFYSGQNKQYFSLRGKYRFDWVSTIGSAQKALPPAEHGMERGRFLGSAIPTKKLAIIGIVVWALLGGLFWRVGSLQLDNGRNLLLAAEDNRFRYHADPAPRGIVYDRNGLALVKNIPGFAVAISPRDILPHHDNREKLFAILQLPDEEVEQLKDPALLQQSSVVVKENVTYEEALKIQAASSDIPGVYVFTTAYREYALDESKSLAHVLGYVGKMSPDEWEAIQSEASTKRDLLYSPNDPIGKQGIERQYEHILRGVYGKVQIEVNAQGKQGRQVSTVQAIPGEAVILSIDLAVQQKLEQIMLEYMDEFGKSRGSAVAIDPRNGEVVGLVSLPGYDNNAFVQGLSTEEFSAILADKDRPLFARAVGGQYPSGSVVKPFVAAAALQEGIITPRTSFLSAGGIRVAQWFFPDWRGGGHGITNVQKAIADSVNTFFYIIGGGHNDIEGLGPDRIKAYLQQFGFGEPTGIDIPGEVSGFIPDEKWKRSAKDEIWYIGDTYNLSIGQGDFLTSPLQMTAATAAIANGGTLYQPRLVKGIGQQDATITKEFESEITNAQMIAQEHLAVIRSGMRETVTNGSAKMLVSLPIAVAGKTGTAQWSSLHENHAWFTSFAPYESPEIVVTVMIEEGESGAGISALIARDFYRWWSQYR